MILFELFWRFAIISALAFGGGIAATPLLERTSVAETGWVSSQDFAAGLAFSYVTPGPFMLVATFVGYKAAGLSGALAATLGVFLIPGILAVGTAHTLRRYLRHPRVQGFGRGAAPAVIGLLLVTALSLFQASHAGWATPVITLTSTALFLWTKLPPILILLGGAGAGLAYGLLASA